MIMKIILICVEPYIMTVDSVCIVRNRHNLHDKTSLDCLALSTFDIILHAKRTIQTDPSKYTQLV